MWGQRGVMAKIHYNILILENSDTNEAEEVSETYTYQSNIQNHIWGCHVQYTGTLDPLQYLIASYDTGARPHILQRWIEATIYNVESSKYGNCVAKHNTILCNLGYRGEPKVFIEIQRKEYNPYRVNRCVNSNLERSQQIVNQ